MKRIFLTLTTMTMFLFASAQNKVYNSEGKRSPFSKEDIDITFAPSTVKFMPAAPDKQKEMAGSLLALLPTVVDIAFKTTTKIIENNVKKYTAEYSKQKSYLEAGDLLVPNFLFTRAMQIDNHDVKALEISVKADTVKNMEAFIYYIDALELNHAAAKNCSKSRVYDYTIEIKVTISTKGEPKVIDLAPIVISGVGFGKNNFPIHKHRSDLIALPKGGALTQVSVKIVETNPFKVRAEKIAAVWNDHKDDIKTIVNNFLPKDKDEEGDGKKTDADKDGDKPAGSDGNSKKTDGGRGGDKSAGSDGAGGAK